jgi:hypothetical protein
VGLEYTNEIDILLHLWVWNAQWMGGCGDRTARYNRDVLSKEEKNQSLRATQLCVLKGTSF